MQHRQLIIAFLILVSASAFAQNPRSGIIKGKVVDKNTKQVIPGVSIILIGTQMGAMTDTTGVFIIRNVPEGDYSLAISFLGYVNKRIDDIRIIGTKTAYLEVEIEGASTALDEVEVNSYQYENNPLTPVSAYSFSREEISRNPGAQGDIFRVIGMLPGVSSSGGQFSAIAVRGQGTGDNVYMVDDVPVFKLSHLEGSSTGFNDPNGGRFSIFAPRVIDNAQFQGGGFAAQYGRRSASYLGLNVKEGSKEDFTIDGQLDLLGATLNYDGPSYISKNTSLFFSARFQDFTNLVRLVDIEDLGIAKYQDFILKTTTDLGKKNKLTFLAILSPETFERDTSNVKKDDKLNLLFTADARRSQQIFGLTLRTLVNTSSTWKNVLYYTAWNYKDSYGNTFPKVDDAGKLVSDLPFAFENGIRKINYFEGRLGIRSIFTKNFDNNALLTAGLDIDRTEVTNERKLSRADTLFVFNENDFTPELNSRYAIITPEYFNATFDESRFNISAYGDYSFTAFEKLNLNVGLRYDYTGFSEQGTLSPRLSVNFQINESNAFNVATGIFYQDPEYTEVADQSKYNRLESERVNQIILGYKKHFSQSVKLTIEAWYKDFDNIIVRAGSQRSEQNNLGDGWASGVDVSLTKRLSKNLHGQIGYSYMTSKRNDHDGKGEYDFDFSQPNQINCLLSYKLNEHWLFSAKFRYATGKPTDRYIVYSDIFSDSNFKRYSQFITGKNENRLPDFISFDVRANYTFRINRLHLTAFLDVVNVMNRQNANLEGFNNITGKTYYDGIAIFPTFGLKFEF
jgi:hypothetical protein